MDNLFVSSRIFQAHVDGVQEEDFKVDFPSLLPDHPAFLYALAGLGELLASAFIKYQKIEKWEFAKTAFVTAMVLQVVQLVFLLTQLHGRILSLFMAKSMKYG